MIDTFELPELDKTPLRQASDDPELLEVDAMYDQLSILNDRFKSRKAVALVIEQSEHSINSQTIEQ